MAMEISSTAFGPGAPIPTRHTCEGDDVSPSLHWQGVPAGAKSLVLVVDDPDAPTEVSGAEIDAVLRPFRPAASECGKANGVPLGTDIGVKMLLASDGKLTNVQPTDRPASDPAVQCILGLVKGAKLDAAGRSKFTSAFFHYSFKVY